MSTPVIPPALEDAIHDELAAQATDPRHPTIIAYDRVRKDFPNGGDEARAAFHRYLREEKLKRDAEENKLLGPKAPNIGKDGLPFCSQTQCPKYGKFTGRCADMNNEDALDICVPAVRDMVIELDARKDAADPAFDEIVKLCGLAKTWEYPAQVIRDVEDALKKRDEQIAALRACVVYARDRRGGMFDYDEWAHMVDKALEGVVPKHALEDAQGREAVAWASVKRMREERDAARAELRDVITIKDAEIARNEELQKQVAALEENGVRMREYRFAIEGIRTDGKGNPITDYDGQIAPSIAKPSDGTNVARPIDDLTGIENSVTDDDPPEVTCGCSPKYIELKPGVHANYCVQAGKPLSDGHQRWSCASCSLVYRHKIDKCLRCGGEMAEVPA